MAKKQFNLETELTAKIDDLTAKLGRASSQINNFKTNAKKGNNNLFDGLAGSFKGLLPVIGAAAIATTTFKGVIATTQTAGDSWALTMASVNGSLEGIYRTIGTGDWSNLFDNMVKSKTAAEELTAALDNLFEQGLSKDINNSEIDLKIAGLEQLRKVAQTNRDFAAVIKYGNEITALEAQKVANSLFVAEKTRSAFFNDIKTITGLSDSEVLSFLKTYNSSTVEKLRAEAEAYNNTLNQLKNTPLYQSNGQFAPVTDNSAAIKQLKENLEKGYSDEAKIYAATLRAYNSLNDEKITSAVNAEIAINKIKEDSIRAQTKNELAKEKAFNREDDFGKKAIDKRVALIDKEKELQTERVKTLGIGNDPYNAMALDKGIFSPAPKAKQAVIPLEFEKLDAYSSRMYQLGTYQQEVMDSGISGWKQIGDNITNTQFLAESFGGAINGLTDAFGGLFQGTEDGFKNVVTSMLSGIQSIINALLAEAIAGMIAKESTKGLLGLITASVGVSALLGLWKSQVPAFETGGIIGGTSFTGDKVLARVNSGEMILNKGQQANLFSMLNSGSGGGGTVEFRIQGNTLVGVLENQGKRIKNMR